MKVCAPVPKATPLTLIESPFSIQLTFIPPAAVHSVSTPVAQAIVSASWRTYGLRVPTCGGPAVVMFICGIVPSAL